MCMWDTNHIEDNMYVRFQYHTFELRIRNAYETNYMYLVAVNVERVKME